MCRIITAPLLRSWSERPIPTAPVLLEVAGKLPKCQCSTGWIPRCELNSGQSAKTPTKRGYRLKMRPGSGSSGGYVCCTLSGHITDIMRALNRINDLAYRHSRNEGIPLDVVVSGRPTMPCQYRSAGTGSSGSRLSRTGELGRLQARAVRLEARCQRYTKVGGRGRGGGIGRVGARFTYSPAQV